MSSIYSSIITPDKDCNLCPRLNKFIHANRSEYPGMHNAPVPSFGTLSAKLLIVGMAPGLKGASFTGRPFTGDYAGDLLYASLLKFGFASGQYDSRSDDGLKLVNTRITNAIRCVPPQNKPVGTEVAACRPFLISEIKEMKNLQIILALGVLAHGAVLGALGVKKNAWKFSHGAMHNISTHLVLADSYHCSRYNTNTGRLTESMFHSVFKNISQMIRT